MDNKYYGTIDWFNAKYDINTGVSYWGYDVRASQRYRHQIYLNKIKRIIINSNILKIIDIGCSDCGLTNKIYNLNKDNKIYGCDISDIAIKTAKKNYPFLNLKVNSLPFLNYKDNEFDIIIATEVLYYLSVDDRILALNEINRILKPGGYLLFSSHIEKSSSYFDKNAAYEFISNYFQVIDNEYIYAKYYSYFENPFYMIYLITQLYKIRNLNSIKYLIPNKILSNFFSNQIIFKFLYVPSILMNLSIKKIISNMTIFKAISEINQIFTPNNSSIIIILAQKK